SRSSETLSKPLNLLALPLAVGVLVMAVGVLVALWGVLLLLVLVDSRSRKCRERSRLRVGLSQFSLPLATACLMHLT
ncbi:MAG: hypothetical protein VKL39_24345, partial [Leptolyngbyaceae bacterium]|nr:hypothetical protein [Leptolyngbyaceae bacterium]